MALEKRKALLSYLGSVAYLLVVAIGYNSMDPTLTRVGLWASFLGFSLWLLLRVRSARPLHIPRISIPIALYLVLRLILTLKAPFPIVSFEFVLREISLILGFIFVFDTLQGAWQAHTWENALINYALIFTLIELALAFFWHRNWWSITGSVSSLPPVGYRASGIFLGHSNVTAGFLGLILPIALLRLFRERSRGKRALWIVGLLLFTILLYFTSSRAGLVATLLGGISAIVLAYGPAFLSRILEGRRKAVRETIRLRWLLFVIPILLIGVGFLYIFFLQSQRITSHAPTLVGARAGIWEPALEIIRDSPWIGHGPGSFAPLYAQETGIPPGFSTSHAHNIALQTAVETGLAGVFLGLIIIAGIARAFIRSWRAAGTDAKFRLAAYGGAGIAMLSQHLLDYLLESPFYSLSLLILLDLMLHECPAPARASTRKKSALLIPAGMLILFLLGSHYTLIGANAYWNGVQAGRKGNWQQAADEICRAYEMRPQIPLYGFQCALALAQLTFQEADVDSMQAAYDLQLQLLEDDPYWPVHWANLAVYAWYSGDETNAIEHMQTALNMAPRNATFALNLACMEQANGQTEDAQATYRAALDISTWLQFSQIYSGSPPAVQALTRFLQDPDAQESVPPALQGWQKLEAGNLAEAETLFNRAIQSNPADSRALIGLALVDMHFNHPEQALDKLQVATFINGNSSAILHGAGVVHWQQGQEEIALQDFQKAFDLIEAKNYSSSYTYRAYNRFFLQSDLAPQMMRGDITPGMAENFALLAQELERSGDLAEAAEIQRRLAIESGNLEATTR